MEKTKSFEELIVWQKAHQFVLDVYALTQSFPREEQFGLTSQFRRASISIAANISVGYKKRGHRDKLKFFNTSQGSISECRTICAWPMISGMRRQQNSVINWKK